MMDAPPSWGGEPEQSFGWKNLASIPVKPIVWVEYPFLQGSAFHLVAGIKNSGKGTWLSSVAARVTNGNLMGVPRNVLWLALGEDSYSIDVRPRIEVAGGDVSMVTVLDGYGFKLPDHLSSLEDQVRETQAGMIVIDPMGGATSGTTSEDWNVRPALAGLNELADREGAMVFGVRHISNKAGKRGEGALSGVLGSSDWVNVPRSLLAVIHDDIDPNTRHLFAITGNRGPADQPGIQLQVESVVMEEHDTEVARMRMLGESNKDPDELLMAKRAKRTTRSDTARIVMAQVLLNEPGGEMNSDVLDTEVARRSGLSARTIRNIRMAMNKQGYLRAKPVRQPGSIEVTEWIAVLTHSGVALASDTDDTPLQQPLTPQGSTEGLVGVRVPRPSWDSRVSTAPPFAGKTSDSAYSSEDLHNFRTLGDSSQEVSTHVSTNGSLESHENRNHGTLEDSRDSRAQPPPQLPLDAPVWERAFWERRNGA
jgi:AAA domain